MQMPPRLYSLTCFVILLSLHCAAAGATPQIKTMDPNKRETMRAGLQADVVKGGDAWLRWFGFACICAPQLWRKVSAAVDKNGIEIIPTQFGNPSKPGSRDGATFRGAESSRRLARAIWLLTAKLDWQPIAKLGRCWRLLHSTTLRIRSLSFHPPKGIY